MEGLGLGKNESSENRVEADDETARKPKPSNSFDSMQLCRSAKRRHEEGGSSSMEVDDLVSAISSKLAQLETTDSLETRIAVFVEVLACGPEEASFFLDSANNDLPTAVALFLEEQSFNRRRFNSNPSLQQLPVEYNPVLRRYRRKIIVIPDLPVEWQASVCPTTGVVMFEHLPTGLTQNQVPPGFADAEAVGTSKSPIISTPSHGTISTSSSSDGISYEEKPAAVDAVDDKVAESSSTMEEDL